MDISAYQHMNIRMSTRGKRPLRNLTPSDKVRAIQRIHNGETKASVSRDIGVPESTLRGWCKNEQKLRFMCRQLGTSTVDQMSMGGGGGGGGVGDNPPEKRSRYDSHLMPKFPQLSGFEDFPYSRLAGLGGMDFAGALNGAARMTAGGGGGGGGGAGGGGNTGGTGLGGSNAILDKIAFNEFMKHNALQAEQGGANSGSNSASSKSLAANLHLQGMMNSLPVTASGSSPTSAMDYPHLSMIQNLNLLSLLNPGLTAMSGAGFAADLLGANGSGAAAAVAGVAGASGAGCDNGGSIKSKPPLRASNSGDSNAREMPKSDSPVVSVKNWAKDPTERRHNGQGGTNSSSKMRNVNNDTNNNDVNSKNAFGLPDLGSGIDATNIAQAAQGIFGLNPLPLPGNGVGGEEDANSPLLDWCKVFNASLNFLALAAAAASLQSPQPGATAGGATADGSTGAGGPGLAESISPMTAPSSTSSNDEASAILKSEHQQLLSGLGVGTGSSSSIETNRLLYKQLTKSAAMAAAAAGDRFSPPSDTLHSDFSNDSYFESEPEDLSVRSATSKMSSPRSIRSASHSPTKSTISNGTTSNVHSDGESNTPPLPPRPKKLSRSAKLSSVSVSSSLSSSSSSSMSMSAAAVQSIDKIDNVAATAASGSTN